MKELIDQWWILGLRAAAALTLAVCVANGEGLEKNLLMQVTALPFITLTLACYGIVDSVLLMALSNRYSNKMLEKQVVMAQALVGAAVGVALLTILFEKATLNWFVALATAQALVTGTFEMISATHFKRHLPDEWSCFAAGAGSLAFAIGLPFLYEGEVRRTFYWLITYALTFSVTMMWFSLRLLTLKKKLEPIASS